MKIISFLALLTLADGLFGLANFNRAENLVTKYFKISKKSLKIILLTEVGLSLIILISIIITTRI